MGEEVYIEFHFRKNNRKQWINLMPFPVAVMPATLFLLPFNEQD